MEKKKIILIIACLLVGFGASYCYFNIINKPDPVVIHEKSEPEIIEREVVITGEEIESGLKEIGELNTAEYFFSRTEYVSSTRKLKINEHTVDIPLTKNGFTYSYDGSIKAGIDFTQVKVVKDDEKKEITVNIPTAIITNSNLDEESYKFYDIENNPFNPISPEDMAKSIVELKKSEEELAIKNGILDTAKENAINVIKNFVNNSYGSSDYTITVNVK